MEAMKLGLMLLLILTNVFCQEVEPDNWRVRMRDESKWPDDELIQDIVVRLTRNQGTRQYVGITGKKDFGKTQRARKRHKFQTFVGLMGKRGFQDRGATYSAED